MDRLRAQILLCHARVRECRLRERINAMTPKLAGVASAMAKLHHGLDARAEKLLARIETAERRGDEAFKKAHGKLDAADTAVGEVETFIAQLECTNGGPTLDGSPESSAAPADDVKRNM
jgi:hypothetical protein